MLSVGAGGMLSLAIGHDWDKAARKVAVLPIEAGRRCLLRENIRTTKYLLMN